MLTDLAARVQRRWSSAYAPLADWQVDQPAFRGLFVESARRLALAIDAGPIARIVVPTSPDRTLAQSAQSAAFRRRTRLSLRKTRPVVDSPYVRTLNQRQRWTDVVAAVHNNEVVVARPLVAAG